MILTEVAIIESAASRSNATQAITLAATWRYRPAPVRRNRRDLGLLCRFAFKKITPVWSILSSSQELRSRPMFTALFGRKSPWFCESRASPERVLDLFGVSGGGTLGQSNAEQERPYLAAKSGKDRAYKAGRLKARGARRESERSEVPVKARKTTRWREGALL